MSALRCFITSKAKLKKRKSWPFRFDVLLTPILIEEDEIGRLNADSSVLMVSHSHGARDFEQVGKRATAAAAAAAQWHSTAMPRNGEQHALHGGVRLALDSGEFILQRAAELPAAPSNLADMPPRACHFQTVPIEMLQQSTAVQWPFFNSSSLSFYREMASGRCNPLSMGSNLTVQGNRLTARAMGRGLRVALAGQRARFSVQIDLERPAKGLEETTTLAARLVGPSLIAAEPLRLELLHGGARGGRRLRASFSYVATEAGAYLVELTLSSVVGESINHLLYRGRAEVLPYASTRSSTSTSSIASRGARPTAEAYDGARTPLGQNGSSILRQAVNTSLCVRSGAAPGRWVRLAGGGCLPRERRANHSSGARCAPRESQEAHALEGRRMLRVLNDEMHYLRGYYYLPHGCHYRHFSAKQAAASLARCGYSVLGFGGDSIGREMLTNLHQLLSGRRRVYVDGRTLKQAVGQLPQVKVGPITLVWQQSGPQSAGPPPNLDVDAYVYSPALVTALAHGWSIECVVKVVTRELRALRAACDARQILCIFRTNSAVQHTQMLDPRLWAGASNGGLTRRTMGAAVAQLKRRASELGFAILDSHAITDAMWYGSWDGLHYTFSARVSDPHGASPFRWQWQGGASHMSTIVLLNMLCNHCHAAPSDRPPPARRTLPAARAFVSILADSSAMRAACPSAAWQARRKQLQQRTLRPGFVALFRRRCLTDPTAFEMRGTNLPDLLTDDHTVSGRCASSRFPTLHAAWAACSNNINCSGVVRDHGLRCGGQPALLQFELRKGDAVEYGTPEPSLRLRGTSGPVAWPWPGWCERQRAPS